MPYFAVGPRGGGHILKKKLKIIAHRARNEKFILITPLKFRLVEILLIRPESYNNKKFIIQHER